MTALSIRRPRAGQQAATRWSQWFVRIAVITLLCLVPGTMHAQFNASLSGTVEDATGAVIPGATITLTSNATQSTKSVTSAASGFYRFNELSPGSYTLTVKAQGFKDNTVSNVMLSAESPRDLDVKLAVGNNSQNVTVNADQIPDLQTSDGSISSTIGEEAIERLPSFGADPYELLRTAPGITGDSARGGTGGALFLPNAAGPGQSNSGIYQTENQIQISAAGLPTADNNYMIDGVSVDSLGRGGAAVVTPNVDAVSQITVVSSSFSAEDGRDAGAQIKVVTKSGSNEVHGTARFQYDEPGLNAYNGFFGPSGQFPQRVDNKQRYYGGSLGGPIVKDKLFFFISGEAFQELNQSFSSQYVETPEYRASLAALRPNNIANAIVAGSGAPRIAQVLNQSCTSPQNIGTPCQVVGDGIDLGSPYGMEGEYVPLAQAQSGNGLDGVPDVQYAEILSPTHTRARQYNARVDYYMTQHDQLAGSVYFTKLDTNGPSGNAGSRPGDDVPFKPLNSAATLLYIHTFGSNMVNELRGNFTRFYDNGIKDAAGTVNYGIPSINIQNMNFDGTNDIQFGVAQSSTTPAIQVENTYEVRDMLTRVFGDHTVKIGVEFRPEQDNSNLDGENRPVYAMAGIWNFFNDTPIYEGITANPATGGPASSQRYLRDHYIGAFGQHDWKVNSNLTLNMGLRWEYFEPIYNKGFNVYQPVESGGAGTLANSILTLHNHYYNSQYHDFSPKVGFAYVPKSDSSMVIRGGFAVAYSRLPDSLFDPSAEDGPGVANFGLCCGTAPTDFGTPYAGGTILYALGSSTSPNSYPINPALKEMIGPTGTPVGQTVEVYGASADTQSPYSYIYALEVQKELGHNYVASLGYQGSESRHEPRLVNQLFIYPNTVGSVSSPYYAYYNVQTDSIGNYNGLNVQLNRRFNRGLTLTAVYTWSKSLDEISNGDGANASANQTYPQDNRTEYGPSDYDVQNRFTASGLWDVPKTRSSNKLIKAVTDGWQVNGIFTAHTGFPFTPVTYQVNGLPTQANISTISPVRPLNYNGKLSPGSCGNDTYTNGSFAPGGGLQYFDIGIAPYSGASGPPGIGRNSFRGPCYQDLDMSVAKQVSFSAMGHQPLLRFQANAYNVLNHTNLAPFNNGNGDNAALIESTQFGVAQTADAGRVLEFLLRLQF
jgi:hypothetical protein